MNFITVTVRSNDLIDFIPEKRTIKFKHLFQLIIQPHRIENMSIDKWFFVLVRNKVQENRCHNLNTNRNFKPKLELNKSKWRAIFIVYLKCTVTHTEISEADWFSWLRNGSQVPLPPPSKCTDDKCEWNRIQVTVLMTMWKHCDHFLKWSYSPIWCETNLIDLFMRMISLDANRTTWVSIPDI